MNFRTKAKYTDEVTPLELANKSLSYDLLMQESFPSWLYPISCGATSMWERWDSLKPDGTVNADGNMVSFNHYAYGSVGNWLYTRVGGLEMTAPGYKTFRIAPKPGGGLTWAKVTHHSPYGQITVDWEVKGDRFLLNVSIPNDTQGEIILPNGVRKIYASGDYSLSCTV